ncbi:MAG TPA: prolyl oligopeptidase family serine peptidase, partial [Sphingobacterium sp.]|nr:prolyl oligopeptidase family serine peptidase [Sphingobacterium sp.]
MKFKKFNYMVVLAAMLNSCTPNQNKTQVNWPDIQTPVADVKPHYRTIHGDTVLDNYYWMNDFFKKGPDSSQVIHYLEEENRYTSLMMKDTEGLQASLFDEMKARIKEKDESVPYLLNGYYYYTRTEEGKQYYKLCRKKENLKAKEEVLLDVDNMAKGYAYYAIGGYSVSPDNKLLVYGVDTVSRRQYTLHIKNLETGEILQDRITQTTGGAVWANDNKTLFYTSKNPVTLLSEKIKRHTLGTTTDTDVTVYDEKDNTNYISVKKSKNNRYIFIQSEGTLSSEVWYLDADQPNETFRVFQPRLKNVLYSVTALDDRFLILTNEGATNFKIVQTPLDKTGKANWTTFIAHRSNVLIEDIEEFRDFVVITERKNGLTNLAIRHLESGEQHDLDLDEAAYRIRVSVNEEYNTNILRYSYTSLVTPASEFYYNMHNKEKTLLKQQDVLGGYNADQYQTERRFATATDGAQVPISLVYKKTTKLDGSAPLYLYDYGSYGMSMDATFSSARLSLLDRGFIYAIAHIRGGEEMGRPWYEDGKMMKKKNTFNDF